ncbi:MAG TPA: hypothetical protein VGZ48_07350 [Candidatus Acidoferrales bacterium]|jgi:hypothetical protein|nr:hypothetical protein [Candidatus Acidoferrales bacterium]
MPANGQGNSVKSKDVFVIQPGRKEGDKSFFRRAGVAFVNRDGSLNVRLDLFPGTQLHIRDRKPKPAEKRK